MTDGDPKAAASLGDLLPDRSERDPGRVAKTTFCILIAAPRSGTTMLGDAVSRSFNAAWPQEIFHGAYTDPGGDFRGSTEIKHRCNFFNLRQELFKQRPELSYPSKANQTLIFDLYLEYLVTSEKLERYFLDIKYTSWHHLNDYWWAFNQRPHLLRDVIRREFPIVHLKRENLFALYCSQMLADRTRVWWTMENHANSDERLAIDGPHCLRFLEDMRAIERLFDRWLYGYPVHELRYEKLLAPGGFSTEVEQTFVEVYGMAPSSPLSTVYRKVTPPLRDLVENADEVLTALRGTEFQSMAEEALS
jgi:LPS sulfotransferase NodH